MKSGTVALIGKPNVGKSTLLNRMVGQKVSIVSNKPQTTRRRVLGIANGPDYQVVFIDTPGIHEPHTRLGKSMVDQARSALGDVDLVLYVADGSKAPTDEDEAIVRMLRPGSGIESVPVHVCLNKMDQLKAEHVVRNVESYTALLGTEKYTLTTATTGQNVDLLLKEILESLPEGERQFDEDEFTDQSARFMSAELVREKILVATRQEVPHAVAVMVDDWAEEANLTRINATILVEKSSQRAILIGKQGQFVKAIGTTARLEIEALIGRPVYLELHVKVAEGWRQNPRVLRELEYSE